MSRTIEQRRAAFALNFINGLNTQIDKAKLKTHIRKTPSLILQCGLGQTLAFLLKEASEDNDAPAKMLYNTLQDWLCKERDENQPMRIYANNQLLEELVAGSRNEYFQAQEESLALFTWLKKFAEAKL